MTEMVFRQDTICHIVDRLNVNHSGGPDHIPLIDKRAQHLTPLLSKLIPLTITNGISPKIWKICTIQPISNTGKLYANRSFVSDLKPYGL